MWEGPQMGVGMINTVLFMAVIFAAVWNIGPHRSQQLREGKQRKWISSLSSCVFAFFCFSSIYPFFSFLVCRVIARRLGLQLTSLRTGRSLEVSWRAAQKCHRLHAIWARKDPSLACHPSFFLLLRCPLPSLRQHVLHLLLPIHGHRSWYGTHYYQYYECINALHAIQEGIICMCTYIQYICPLLLSVSLVYQLSFLSLPVWVSRFRIAEWHRAYSVLPAAVIERKQSAS